MTEISRLSLRAIELATLLHGRVLGRIAAFLYFYNRMPISRRWMERIPDEAALLRFLGIGEDKRWPGSRNVHPFTRGMGDTDPFWMYWNIDKHTRPPQKSGSGFKVYVSPKCEDLPLTIQHVGMVLESSGAHMVKIGRNAQVLLRPDKLMIYFNILQDAVRFGRRLLSEVSLTRAQAVPFTYPLDPIGLVSIGFDPPPTARWHDGREGRSWRLWATECVAAAIMRVQEHDGTCQIERVLTEVRGRQIDPILWRPRDATWATVNKG